MPPERAGDVAGILLAAGMSSRMGSNKMLFELDGESVLRRAAKRALAGGLSPLVVVLGHESDKTARELEGLPCEWALNPLYEQGINSSLKSGIMAVQGMKAQAALVMLADMPFVTAEMIAAMIDRYRTTAAAARHLRLRRRQRAAHGLRPQPFHGAADDDRRRLRPAGGKAPQVGGRGPPLARRRARRPRRAGGLRAGEER